MVVIECSVKGFWFLRSEGDDERFTLTVLKACSKDLGLYKCTLSTSNISVSTSEYHLTSEGEPAQAAFHLRGYKLTFSIC